MNRFAPPLAALCVLSVLSVLAVSAVPAAAGGIFPFPRETFTLANGLAVVVIPCPSEGLVMDALIVDVGMRAEAKPDEVEYTHLLEHLMFRGSKNYPREKAKELYTLAGAYEQGFTESDFTCYYRIYPAESFAEMTALMADKFRGLAFTDEEYKAETGAVLGEYTGHCDTPDSRLWNELWRTAFSVHPYRAIPAAEHRATLERMPENRARVMAFYERFYKPNNMRLVICGAVDPAAVRAAVEAAYGSLVPGEAVPAAPPEPPSHAERRSEITGEPGTAPRIAIAWRIPGYDPGAPETPALALLADVHFVNGSPLHRELVDEKGLAAVVSWPRHFFARDPSLLALTVEAKRAEDLPEIERIVLDHVRSMTTNRMRRDRLEAAKRKSRYAFLVRLDSLDDTLFGFCKGYFLHPSPDAIDRYHDTLARLGPDDLRAVARRVFRPENRVVVILRPASASPAQKGGDAR